MTEDINDSTNNFVKMKKNKLYLVETTSERCEINTGFYFVMTEDIKDATKTVNEIPDEKIISVNIVNRLMIDSVFRTVSIISEE